MKVVLCVYLSLLCQIGGFAPVVRADCTNCYVAAVFEHQPLFTIAENLRKYDVAATEASQNNAKIIVFPEYGLLAYESKSRTHLKEILPSLPTLNENKNPCVDLKYPDKSMDTMVELSCLARSKKIIIAVNFGSTEYCDVFSDTRCPPDEQYIYNTNFIFDSDGTLRGFYRKFHLYNEDYFNSPKEFDFTVIETSIGKFGTFTCFDIIFGNSVKLVTEYHVSNVIYPTFWVDGYPLHVSVQLQESWARAFNVNVLAANIHYPNSGAIGSGIFSGVTGALNYTYSTDHKNRIILASVPKNPSKRIDITTNVKLSGNLEKHFMFNTSFQGYHMRELSEKSDSFSVDDNGLTCNIEYGFVVREPNEKYYFSAFKGLMHTHDKKHFWAVELCILVACNDNRCKDIRRETRSNFNYLKITGEFSVKHVLPSMLMDGFETADTNAWTVLPSKIESKCTKCRPVITAALCGRNYKLDRYVRQ